MSSTFNPYFFTPEPPFLKDGYICAAKPHVLATLSVARRDALTAFASSFRPPSLSPSDAAPWMGNAPPLQSLHKIQSFARRINQVQGKVKVPSSPHLIGRFDDSALYGGSAFNVFFGTPIHGVEFASLDLAPSSPSPYASAWCTIYNLLMRPSSFAKGKESTLADATSPLLSPLLSSPSSLSPLPIDPYEFYSFVSDASLQLITIPLLGNKITSLPQYMVDMAAAVGDGDSFSAALSHNRDILNVTLSLPTIFLNRAKVLPLPASRTPTSPLILARRTPFGAKLRALVAASFDDAADHRTLQLAATSLARVTRAAAHQAGIKGNSKIKGVRT